MIFFKANNFIVIFVRIIIYVWNRSYKLLVFRFSLKTRFFFAANLIFYLNWKTIIAYFLLFDIKKNTCLRFSYPYLNRLFQTQPTPGFKNIFQKKKNFVFLNFLLNQLKFLTDKNRHWFGISSLKGCAIWFENLKLECLKTNSSMDAYVELSQYSKLKPFLSKEKVKLKNCKVSKKYWQK